MNVQTRLPRGSSFFEEMSEFAGFAPAAQRYIRRSLDVGLGHGSTMHRWARNADEATSIRNQAIIYGRLDDLRAVVRHCDDLVPQEAVMAPLITLSAFDLAQYRLGGFDAYRFLYERLIGARVRPWLPAAFYAAATLPHIHPETRRELLRGIKGPVATASGWSIREPVFFPEWVEKVEAPAAT